jgi:hypothetical protein
VGIYGIHIFIIDVSGQESAIHNLYKLVSVVILVLVVNFKNYPPQHLSLQHHHTLHGVAVKVGAILLSHAAFQSKGRWLNHLDVHKPYYIRW